VRKKWRQTNFKYPITSPVKFGIRATDKGLMEMSGHKKNHTGLLELDKFDTHIRKQKCLSFEYWICGRCKTRIKLHLRNCLDQRNGGKQCITLSRVGRGREHNEMNRLASQDWLPCSSQRRLLDSSFAESIHRENYKQITVS
jgi:hypothetical protein